MTKRIEGLDGRLIFEMLPRCFLTTVELERWNRRLADSLPAMAAWLGEERAKDLIGGVAVYLAFTKTVEVVATHEPALVAFKAWLEGPTDDVTAWIKAYAEIPQPITDAWGEAFSAGLQVFEITPERKPFDLMKPSEVEAATDPKASSLNGAGNGSKSKSPKPRKESRAAVVMSSQ